MANHTEWLFGLPAIYKFNKLWLQAGPGIELAKDHENNVDYYFLPESEEVVISTLKR